MPLSEQQHPTSMELALAQDSIPSPHKTGAVLVAAGRGRRMDGVDKIFYSIHGFPLLSYPLRVLQSSPQIDVIVLVLPEDSIEKGKSLVQTLKCTKVAAVCAGGKRRQDSVEAGLALLDDVEWVLIHDGARPCLTTQLIQQSLDCVKRSGAAVPSVPLKETVKEVREKDGHEIITGTPIRDRLRLIQTPQAFEISLLRQAYSQIKAEVTDEASLVEQLGHRIETFPGSYSNIKITTPEDLTIAETLLTMLWGKEQNEPS